MDLLHCFNILLASIAFMFLFHKIKSHKNKNLPPGTTGWPIIGETLDFFVQGRAGRPEKFIFDRTVKYSQDIFRTSLVGDNVAVVCGPAANKFVFTGENKYLATWWPQSVQKVLFFKGAHSHETIGYLAEFLRPELLQKYIHVMDSTARNHLESLWLPHKQVKVLPLAKTYAFSLASRLFLSIQDPEELEKRFYKPFSHLVAGIFSMPINLPGTAFHRAMKGSKIIRDDIIGIIKQRKKDLLTNKASVPNDLLTRVLVIEDQNGRTISEKKMAELIVALLYAAHDTTGSIITLAMNYIAENPLVYAEVLKEQTEISNSKASGELLNWEDIKKMKYTWCVLCETLRMSPVGPGPFKEAITDFTYEGFTIPKGWKVFSPTHSTHKNSRYFPDPDSFDPSRFQGNRLAPYVFVPFGGGPRMCPGKEYARLEMLVFLHYMVTNFKWEKINPEEKVICNPFPTPVNGLLIRLQKHNN